MLDGGALQAWARVEASAFFQTSLGLPQGNVTSYHRIT